MAPHRRPPVRRPHRRRRPRPAAGNANGNPGTAPAPSNTTANLGTAPSSGTAAGAPKPTPAAGASETGTADFGKVVSYVADYNGGACFAAIPTQLPDGSLSVTAFSTSNQASAAFENAFATTFGAAPTLLSNSVSTTQCGALSFIRQTPGYPNLELGVKLIDQQVASGGLLAGRVDNAQDLQVHLFIVDNDGKIESGDRYAQAAGSAVTFAVPVFLTGGASSSVQLLVSIAVPAAASVDAFAVPKGGDANAFFERLRQELAAKHLVATVGVSPFAVN